jgi:2'-5' RNA ligase
VIRAFIAIEFAAATVNRITAAIEQLKPHIVGIRWVASANYHLTLKFLGTIDASQSETIGQALADALHPFQRFTINAYGLGVFPCVKRPRVIWVA